MQRFYAALLSAPGLAYASATCAGTAYDLTITQLNQSTIAGVAAGQVTEETGFGAPRTTPYFVEDGKVRVGAPIARTAYLFIGRLMYVIDSRSMSVDVMKHATLSDVTAHYDAVLKQLDDAAANAPLSRREAAQRKASDMKLVRERIQPGAPVYSVTTRSDSIEGHACKIWEERENRVKRLELCIAPAASVPGGAEILNGMKTLGQFRQGSNFAFGVEFGLGSWWADFAALGGVPLIVREFKYDLATSLVTLTMITSGVPPATKLELPQGYEVREAPAYMQWNVR